MTAIMVLLGLALICLLWAEDIRADQERLKAAPDITHRLPEMYARPALTRRNRN